MENKRPKNITQFKSVYFEEDKFRCPCCGVLTISPILILGLEKLAKIIGKFRILYGYRCEAFNSKINGKPLSQHLVGNAADIGPDLPCSIYEVRDVSGSFRPFKNGGIGLYKKGYVHLDVRGYPARWGP